MIKFTVLRWKWTHTVQSPFSINIWTWKPSLRIQVLDHLVTPDNFNKLNYCKVVSKSAFFLSKDVFLAVAVVVAKPLWFVPQGPYEKPNLHYKNATGQLLRFRLPVSVVLFTLPLVTVINLPCLFLLQGCQSVRDRKEDSSQNGRRSFELL